MKTHLSPKEFGQATGISESSVKRWIDQQTIIAVRTEGGHRRIPIDEAVRYIRENRLVIVAPQVLGLRDLEKTSPGRLDLDSAPAALSQALQAGLGPQVRGILLSLYLAGHSIPAIADGPIARAMHEIGELWKQSKAGIFVEHRATDICAHAIHQLQSLLPPPPDDAPVAIGAAPADDPYIIPSLLVAATLSSIGWRAINLGPQTPLDVLALASEADRPLLHWISITSSQLRSNFTSELRHFCDHLKAQGAYIIVGGQQMSELSIPPSSSLHIANTMAELAAYARGLHEARRHQIQQTLDADSTTLIDSNSEK